MCTTHSLNYTPYTVDVSRYADMRTSPFNSMIVSVGLYTYTIATVEHRCIAAAAAAAAAACGLPLCSKQRLVQFLDCDNAITF
mmetsp:Transcript_37208/g.54789  ORF Transcript_37208/g.54789 Transcript_37208/m.54789 type:complete len:83 (-) Transcript_37208:519-767(-)